MLLSGDVNLTRLISIIIHCRVIKKPVHKTISHYATVEQSITFHQTHYRSYRGRVFTGQMTQPTVSKQWKSSHWTVHVKAVLEQQQQQQRNISALTVAHVNVQYYKRCVQNKMKYTTTRPTQPGHPSVGRWNEYYRKERVSSAHRPRKVFESWGQTGMKTKVVLGVGQEGVDPSHNWGLGVLPQKI